MFWLELIALLGFVILMAIGYKNNNRNLMLAASILLFAGLGLPDFIDGFTQGYAQAAS